MERGWSSRRKFLSTGAGAAASLLALAYYRLASPPPSIKSLAVLPLRDLPRATAEDYFSAGITNALIGELGRNPDLRVLAPLPVRSSRKSADDLQVDAVIDGTIKRTDSKVLLALRLTRAGNERAVWSQVFERDLIDVLALPQDLARAVAPAQKIVRPWRKVKPTAFDTLLQAQFLLNKPVPEISAGLELFQKAIALDPTQPDSHAGLALALCLAGMTNAHSSGETYPAARNAALKALSLDQSNTTAQSVLAEVKKGYDWDLEGAVKGYQRALRLNPSYLPARLWYSECLARMERFDEALSESDIALVLDPLSPVSSTQRSMILFFARRYDEAVDASEQALKREPLFEPALLWQGAAYAGSGDSKCLEVLAKAASIRDNPSGKAVLGYAHARFGRKPQAQAILTSIMEVAGKQYVCPIDIAIVHAGLGDADASCKWLQRAYEERTTRMHQLRSMFFDSLHADPRYAKLLSLLGQPNP